jgi:hypothetical protein
MKLEEIERSLIKIEKTNSEITDSLSIVQIKLDRLLAATLPLYPEGCVHIWVKDTSTTAVTYKCALCGKIQTPPWNL